MIDRVPVNPLDPIAIGRPSRAAKVKGGGLFSGFRTHLPTMPVRKMWAASAALPLAAASTMAG
ncbi:hypothetical protein [Phyllobacterium sp. K27]